MKTVFKASLLASAMAFTMGAQAATISSTPLQLSAEGVAVGLTAPSQALSFDIVVGELHPSASTITLTFDGNIDLTTLVGGAVTNNPTSGTGTAGGVTFSYGTGSFTFDNVVIDTATAGAHTISFQVNLGNPLTASSAFRVAIGATTTVSGASTLSYSSADSAMNAIETGTGTIAETANQFTAAVTTELDGLIERIARVTFTDASDIDVLGLSLTNNADNLAASLDVVTGTAVLGGDFTGVVTADWVSAVGLTVPAGVVNVDEDEVAFAVAAADLTTDGVADTVVITFDEQDGTELPITGNVSVVVTLDGTNNPTSDPVVITLDAGQWQLDASIVNVPYLPVGYGLSPNVEISNEGSTDAEIMVEGFDQFGTEYPSVALSFMAEKNTVTKVSEADLQTAFGLATTDKRKLSVTFVLDADADKITLAPYYKEGTSRVNVMSSQYKGIKN